MAHRAGAARMDAGRETAAGGTGTEMIKRFAQGWRRRREQFSYWKRRNGLVAPRPRWPGIIHQGWGWYDGLSSFGAVAFSLAVVLFLFATAMYLLGASVLVSSAHNATEAAAAAAVAEPTEPTPEPSAPAVDLAPTPVAASPRAEATARPAIGAAAPATASTRPPAAPDPVQQRPTSTPRLIPVGPSG